jgi:hypothetical protein
MNQVFGRFLVLTIVFVLTGSILINWPAADIRTVDAQTLRSNSNAAPPRPPVVDDFVPEFVDLPNFGEPEKEITSISSRAKLIEISEFQSPDEQWPSYSRDDLTFRSGENWLGLYRFGQVLQLANTKITRSQRKGYIGPGDQPYDWLKYERKGELLFLVKDVPELKPGKVTTLYRQEMLEGSSDSEMSDGYRREFVLDKDTYILRTSRGITNNGTKAAVLVLERNGISQVIDKNFHSPAEDRDIIGSLIWAGDLDGDGKLDLYTDWFNEKGSVMTRLYLSSYASDGDIVGLAATFSSSGC